jgi:hypothetical protein
MLQGGPAAFEKYAMLRIHNLCLARGETKKLRIEILDFVKEWSCPYIGLAI